MPPAGNSKMARRRAAPTSRRFSDDEVATIRRKLAENWRGPVLLKWLEELLAGREELVARIRLLEGERKEEPVDAPSARP